MKKKICYKSDIYIDTHIDIYIDTHIYDQQKITMNITRKT